MLNGEQDTIEREIMKPWDRYEILPNWKSEITFEDGVTMI